MPFNHWTGMIPIPMPFQLLLLVCAAQLLSHVTTRQRLLFMSVLRFDVRCFWLASSASTCCCSCCLWCCILPLMAACRKTSTPDRKSQHKRVHTGILCAQCSHNHYCTEGKSSSQASSCAAGNRCAGTIYCAEQCMIHTYLLSAAQTVVLLRCSCL